MLGLDLEKEHKIAVEHLQAIEETVPWVFVDLDGVQGTQLYLVGLHVGEYLEAVDE